MKVTQIKLAHLRPAPWNANRVPAETLAKIKESIRRYGVVENLVVRPLPGVDAYEVISGNHRLAIYAEEGMPTAPCYVIELDDANARLLAETLNRTRGEDDPEAYAALLRDVLAELSIEDVTALLPETEETVASILGLGGDEGDPGPERTTFESQFGVIVVCADEGEQQLVYEKLTDDGYECRVVVT